VHTRRYSELVWKARMKPWRVVFLVLMWTIDSGVMAQTARVNWLVNAPFADYKTYSWKEPSAVKTDFFTQFVTPAVDAQLAAKGIKKAGAGQKPDLWVAYHVQTQESPDSEATLDGFGVGPDKWGLSDCWDGCGWGEHDNHSNDVSALAPHMMAILTLDLADARKMKLVWRGQAIVDSVSSSQRRDEKQVEKAVEKMFKKYPPK
jgi:Domain of unknown function (DUF4136)